ncbi:hypothetical protein NDU88_005523 [Pleurodeles waltl]|uniref:Uncharacterized protein n=1 Tax=Pleurodeles waltl TaxID=8319 RepID=A0AAV7MWR2_PLEWA|nr:hypothetical protein NDU88_005523 [Pleurodeles waltl]
MTMNWLIGQPEVEVVYVRRNVAVEEEVEDATCGCEGVVWCVRVYRSRRDQQVGGRVRGQGSGKWCDKASTAPRPDANATMVAKPVDKKINVDKEAAVLT